VTGASSGIGRAIALALADAGARVWAVGRDGGTLASLGGGDIVPVVGDLALDDGPDEVAGSVLSDTTAVDVLVHAAGTIAVGTLEAVGPDELDRQYRVNLRAPYVLTRALLPALAHAQGQVVFVNSSAALRASSGNASYAATKAGLKAVAEALRDDVNPRGIRVLSLYVGRTATPMQEAVHRAEGREYDAGMLLRPEDVGDIVLSSLVLSRSGEVTDVSLRPLQKPRELGS
jgi:NAD(P)-dependent dehydrogenase (short-subunit alcohol dehydrogenase family)